ncbi:DMT family transporter [Salipiger bermudensis]|uniref:Integral membrane protein n=1 Tax=Salipiger bermudensis (strain DSM 26914 / JCM 13377 / KCTC 12554 / HTCC2601) TaxID=314265 RepID=Q0FR64_SALBH|nr:DMT family transporter [Salipiger bermudensis]EAU46723.1 integral membrane protein [Salipiger bermudensis HTCC2601]
MLSFSALVAGSFAMGSLAAPHIAPTALNAVRFVLAGLILSGVAAASGKVTRASLEAPWRYLVLGGLMIAYFVLMFEGLKTAAPVSMSAVFTLTPLMAAGFGWLLMRQRMTGRMALALAVGAVGALWVIFDGSLQAALRFGVGRGEAVYFVGCAAHAVYAPLVRKLNRGEPALVFTLWTNLAGTAMLLIWGWPALMATDWTALPPIVWITIAYTAIAATAATFVLLQFAALRLPSAKVMAYTYLTPSWVILWTLVLGQGVPPAVILVGVALTVVALLLLLKNE